MMIVRKALKELSISKERLGQLNAIRYKDIDYSEIPKLDEDFWKKPHREESRRLPTTG